MANLLDKFVRVTAETPCPKCGREDWCLLQKDGRTCVCQREPSGKPYGCAGWLHYLPDGAVKPVPQQREKKVYLRTSQVQEYLDSLLRDDVRGLLINQANMLKLPVKALIAMRVIYETNLAALAFPMFDGLLRPTGCRYRRSDGRKWSLKGGREGVFLSRSFDPSQPVFVAEGPTDAAALVHAGLPNVIGRPNCSGGRSIIASLLNRYMQTPVIMVADPDEPGTDGAAQLALHLPNPCVVLAGPTDVRDFVIKQILPSGCRQVILESLGGNELSPFKTVFKNNRGKLFNFLEAMESELCLTT